MSAPLHAGIHPWADTPPAQCKLGYSQQAGGMHPTGMHSCLGCCGLLKVCLHWQRPRPRLRLIPTLIELGLMKCSEMVTVDLDQD